MTWVRIDDDLPDHRKIVRLGSDAFRLHVSAMCWSSKQLTDGFIPADAIPRLTWFARNSEELISQLVAPDGVWHVVEGGYQIHDYLDYNPSREQVLKEREEARLRMAGKRKGRGVREKFARTSEEIQIPPSPSPVKDDEIAQPRPWTHDIYERHIGQLTPMVCEDLARIAIFSPEDVEAAFIEVQQRMALKRIAQPAAYAETILLDWRQHGRPNRSNGKGTQHGNGQSRGRAKGTVSSSYAAQLQPFEAHG